jgi:hypothetical protein
MSRKLVTLSDLGKQENSDDDEQDYYAGGEKRFRLSANLILTNAVASQSVHQSLETELLSLWRI